MRKALTFVTLAALSVGCAKGGAVADPTTPSAAKSDEAPVATDGPSRASTDRPKNPNGSWIGAAPESEMLPSGTRETFLGVWVDVPDTRPETRPPMEVVLVIDTSGSMAGQKISNARSAATTLVKNLRDGDIVGLDAFSDHARTVVAPTRLDAVSREEILRQIAQLREGGSTNMFEGLSLAEGQIGATPASHPLRRVVLISDGIANVGPSSPEVLGSIAERGLRFRAQVTSLGVGNDYDEHTLNALAIRSSGRLYHLDERQEMATVMKGEIDMLNNTLASEAFMEVVPAPGVQLLGADGSNLAQWVPTAEGQNALRIPLGALTAGQHREALVKVRIQDPEAFEGHARSMASVRLRFRDAQENDLERIQETIARAQMTNDSGAVARTANMRTKTIVALSEASTKQIAASQRINDGNFIDADKELERAERQLASQAQQTTSAPEKRRLEAAAGRVAQTRRAAAAMPSAPKAVQRESALKLNADALHDMGK